MEQTILVRDSENGCTVTKLCTGPSCGIEISLSWSDMAKIAIMLERKEVRDEVEDYLDGFETDSLTTQDLLGSEKFIEAVVDETRKIRTGNENGDNIYDAMRKVATDNGVYFF